MAPLNPAGLQQVLPTVRAVAHSLHQSIDYVGARIEPVRYPSYLIIVFHDRATITLPHVITVSPELAALLVAPVNPENL